MAFSTRQYIRDLIEKGYTKSEIYDNYHEVATIYEEDGRIPPMVESFYKEVRRCFKEKGINFDRYKEADKDLLLRANDIARQKQSIQDNKRIDNKIFRENSRTVNMLESLNREFIDIIPRVKLEPFKPKKKDKKSEAKFGIIGLNDLHFNEIIEQTDLGNEYDFEIASARLKKYAEKADKIFSSQGINHVIICFLGDLLNSDRRISEIQYAATNRAKATFLSAYILQQFISDLLSKGYKITINSVTGNESRIDKDFEVTDMAVSNNFDYVIHNMLKIMFEKIKNIDFISGDWKESLISIDGFNLLLLHGEYLKGEKSMEQLFSKWSKKGVILNFVIYGHYHSTMITDFSARGASLCGSNDYSDRGLNLFSRASQNIHIVNKDNGVDSIKLDLQNVDRKDGYNVIEELKAYNAKSSQKLHTPMTILEVRI